MKVLLDECIPRKLRSAFAEHDCMTAPEAGLAGKKNGVLLSLAESAGFDVFLTLDKGIQYQQSVAGRSTAFVSGGVAKGSTLGAPATAAGSILPPGLFAKCRLAL
jgi:hypothetical protein